MPRVHVLCGFLTIVCYLILVAFRLPRSKEPVREGSVERFNSHIGRCDDKTCFQRVALFVIDGLRINAPIIDDSILKVDADLAFTCRSCGSWVGGVGQRV